MKAASDQMGMTLQIKGSLNYAFSSDSWGDSIWDKASGLTLQCGSGTTDIFKTFFLWRNFCRGKNKTNKKNQQQQKPPDNNKPKPTIILMIYLSVLIQIRKKDEKKKGKKISQDYCRMVTISVLKTGIWFMLKSMLSEPKLHFPNIY